MTEDEHKKTIIKHLTRLREDIQSAQDVCATNITTHLEAIGFEFEGANDFDVYEAIEKAAGLDTEDFFSSVSYTINSMCEDIIWNQG